MWFLAWPPTIFQKWQLPVKQLQASSFLITCTDCEVYFSLQIVEKPRSSPQQVDAVALGLHEAFTQESEVPSPLLLLPPLVCLSSILTFLSLVFVLCHVFLLHFPNTLQISTPCLLFINAYFLLFLHTIYPYFNLSLFFAFSLCP